MAHILVSGGTGDLGREVVRELLAAGHSVRVLSRRARQEADPTVVEWARADLERDRGIREAVAGVNAIVHAASGTGPRPGVRSQRGLREHSAAVDVTGTERLLRAARDAGVSHLLYVSIVGMEQVPYFYYRRKLAAEALVREGRVPWTILRATQFHTLLDYALEQAARFPMLALPTGWRFQPVAPADVAGRIREALAAAPAGQLPDFGGPEVQRLDDLARVWLRAHGLRKAVVPLWVPGRFAAAVSRGRLTCPEHREGAITWLEWLHARSISSK
jgi:uncharacterized protein YbjT (DUF2867 family)